MASKPKITGRPLKLRSAVWNHFEFVKGDDGKPDETQTICQICDKTISRPKGSTSAMRAHLKTHQTHLSGELKKPHQQIEASTSDIDMEPMQGEQNAMQQKEHHGNATIDEAEFSKVKNIMECVQGKISRKTELNKFLKGKICDLKESKMERVGVFGRTGAGKSSLINAIIGVEDLLPSGGESACTSVMIQVQANMNLIDSKYIAEIEFISAKEWKDELDFYFLKNPDSENNKEGDSDDDDIKEKISALYPEDAKNLTVLKDVYMDKKYFKKIPEFLKSQKKTLKCDTSSELSDKIAKYTRRDSEGETGSNTGTRFWPLVKCVTIKIPNASELLQHVALVDLPGTGDCNKSRDEMWKRFVGDCSAVWIVSDTSRADSEKEPWEILNQTISLIGNGGECRTISFICTKCDVIDGKYKKLNNKEKRDHVLQKNERVKEQVRKKFDKEKGVIEKHFSGDNDFFKVFTVTSEDVNELKYLQEGDTDIPKLQKFVKLLNEHQSKTNYYVSGAYGILSLMKAANTPETGSLLVDVCNRETRLQDWIEVDQAIMKCKEALETCLDEGVRLSLKSCESILKDVTEGKTVHHSMLKSLVQNNGIYKKTKNRRKTEVNLNERLSKHMRETIDQEFSKTFPNGRPGPIKEAINKFTLLQTDSLSDKHEGSLALQMTFLKTEEEKLNKKLANVICKEKKNIYFSLTKSIKESMQPCYNKAAELSGKGMLEDMRKKMLEHLNTSKSTMFVNAKDCMLDLVESLKDTLLETLQEYMLTSIDRSLKTNDHSVPDVTEQYEEVKKIYDKLKGSSRSSANTGIKESTDSPSPSCMSMKTDKLKKQTWSPVLSSNELISNVLQHIRCCKCSSIMTDPVAIPCGHSYCERCINTYWAEPSPTSGDYVCPLTPLCKKRYPVRPELTVNEALSSVLKVLQQTDCSTLTQTGSGDEKMEEEPSRESEEHQGSACKRRKMAGEEEDEMFQHSSELEQSARNTEAEPQQEKHDLRKQPDVVSEQIKVSSSQYENLSGGAIEMVSPASSPVQPQQDKPGDRRPQAKASSKHFVDQHRRKLIESVTNVESILEVLREEGVITQDAYNKVASKATNQEKMRELYPHLKTQKAKVVFCNGLREYEKDLLKELE